MPHGISNFLLDDYKLLLDVLETFGNKCIHSSVKIQLVSSDHSIDISLKWAWIVDVMIQAI